MFVTKMDNNGWELLAAAIVQRAIEDYWLCIEKSKKKPDYKNAEFYGLRRFFLSEWFQALCKLDGEYLMQEIEHCVEQNQKIRQQGCNSRVRKALYDYDMSCIQLSHKLGITVNTLYGKLRTELPKKEQDRLIAIIKKYGEKE